MKKLFKKLFRDIKKALGQFIAITIVSAIGVMLLTGLAVTHLSLLNTTNSYYKKCNLADLSAYYLGINDVGINKLKKIKGVNEVYGRLFLKGENSKINSSFFVHTVSEDEKINIPLLDKGHIPQTNSECMLDSAYAAANNLSVGDKITVNINQKPYNFIISGIFNTAEYVYLIEDSTKSMIPAPKTFGLLYVNKSLIQSLVGSSTYNEVLVTLKSNADAALVSKDIENLTDNYGFGHITLRKDQLSDSQLQSDIVSSGSISKLFPYVFFLVAAVIIFISTSRTVQSERIQIGLMKALGISYSSITFHYLSYSLLCGITGSIFGNVIGILTLPKLMFETYKMLYVFPKIEYSGYWWYIIVSTFAVILFGLIASLLSTRKPLKELPAQCMRPIPPKKVHKTWLEKRQKLWNRISYKNKLIIRNILLNKKRAVLSSIGVIGCVGVLMCAFGLKETTSKLLDVQFGKIQKYDSMVLLSKPVQYSDAIPFNNDNIANTDKFSVVDVTMSLKKNISSVMYVLPQHNMSVELYDNQNKKLELSANGITVPYKLAKENHIKVGDTIKLKLESALYNNQNIKVKVTAISVLFVSQDLYVSAEYLQSLKISPYVIGYYVNLKNQAKAVSTNKYIEGVRNVKSIAVKSQMLAQLKSIYKIMDTMIYIMIIMSACLALAVIFNISSINIFERRRDIATLKVLGYHKKEINSLVHVENLFITAFGCVFGIIFGCIIYSAILTTAVSEEQYFPYKITFTMVALSVLLAFVFTLFANFMLKGKTRKIDMVESLKSVE